VSGTITIPASGGSFDIEELDGPKLSGTRDGPTGIRTFKVPWTKVEAFLGYVFPPIVNRGTAWSFPDPQTFTLGTSPSFSHLLAIAYEVEPFDPDATTGIDANNLRNYLDTVGSRITISYGPAPYDKSRKDWIAKGSSLCVDWSTEFSAQMLRLGKPGWVWVTQVSKPPIKSEEVSLGKMVPCEEHNLEWLYVPEPPLNTIRATIGCVNNDKFLFNAPPETLLLVGARTRRSWTVTGQECYTVSYKILDRWIKSSVQPYVGWNFVWNPDRNPPGWDQPAYASGSSGSDNYDSYLYKRMDFKDLFKRDDTFDVKQQN